MPYPYQIAAGKMALRPRQRPGPYYYATGDRIFVVLRDDSTRELEVHYSDDAGVTWAEADSANRPLQSATNDTQEGLLHRGAMVRRSGNTLYVMYAKSGGTQLAFKPFNMATAAWGTEVSGGPSTDFGWEFEVVGSDVHCFYSVIVSTTPVQYQIRRRDYLSGAWEVSSQNITDPATEDELQIGGAVERSTNILNLVRFTSGKYCLFYVLNNNNISGTENPSLRARIIDGDTVSAPIASRLALPANSIDVEAYFNGAAIIATCGGTEIACLPALIDTTSSTLQNYAGSGKYYDRGLAMVYEAATPYSLRLDLLGTPGLSLQEVGMFWDEVPSVIAETNGGVLRYFYSQSYEDSHPTDEGDCDLTVQASKIGQWDAPSVVFATTGNEIVPGRFSNTFAHKSPGWIGSDIGFILQEAAGRTGDYENPHYYQYTPTACALASTCGAAQSIGNINSAIGAR